jgi:nickel-dependent lactate racemase
MRISFPYPKTDPVDVPKKNLLGIFSPSILKIKETEKEIVEKAFSQPIGSEPLSQILKGRKNVLIIVDDYTRTTPMRMILPRLFKEMERGGVKSDGIKILIGLGTHRSMTEDEITRKFGKDIPRRYPIFNHSWWDQSQLINLGETEKGTPIFVNRMVQQADFILGIGQIVPHRISGFSGGGNIIQPGICGEETTGKTHWLAAQFSGREILGRVENPVKEEIEKVAQKVGLSWIVNTIQDGSGRLVGVVAGDPLKAYREGARKSFKIYKSILPQEADIVLTDSHPYDSELWLAAKGIYAAELGVRQGGVTILVTLCTEGVSPSHPEILELGYQTYEEVDRKVRQGMIKKLTMAAHLVHVGRVIKERGRGIMVSQGISKQETEKLGFLYARTAQEALEVGLSLVGRDGKVAVFQRGGEILPVIASSS